MIETLITDSSLVYTGGDLARFGRFVVNGLVVGSILALAGVGLTLVYGILRIANFAHGDFLTLGAYLTLYFVALITLPHTMVWGIAIACLLALLVAFDRFLWPRLRKPDRSDATGGPAREDEDGVKSALSPTESGLVLLAAGLLVLLVAGIRFPVPLSAPSSFVLVVMVAAVPVTLQTVRLARSQSGLWSVLGVWAGIGAGAGTAVHLLAPYQTGPGGLPLAMEVAVAFMVFTIGLIRFRRDLGHDRPTQTALVAAGAVGVFLFAGPTLLAMAISLAAVAAFMVLLELIMWRRARRQGAGLLTMIIIAIGLMLALRNSIVVVWGTGQRSFPGTLQPREPILGTAVGITPNQAIVVFMTVLLILAMHFFLKHTKMGKAMRALADDIELARVSGINVDRVVIYVWILAGVLAAIAGTLFAMVRPFDENLGWFQVLPVFAAVILGGIGSPYGAMLGGYIIGLVMEVSPFFGVPIDYKLVVGFGVLILVMIFRPKGIMGGQATR